MHSKIEVMKIAIDVSQLVYRQTGVANYLNQLLTHLLEIDQVNHYILFASSLRQNLSFLSKEFGDFPRVTIKTVKLPPSLLDIIWNRLHILPIELFVGDIDIFISSDWTEPPTRHAKKLTILYDTIVYTYPNETAENIVQVQKRKLSWVKKESALIWCISEATKKDAMRLLGISEEKLAVVYPGVTL